MIKEITKKEAIEFLKTHKTLFLSIYEIYAEKSSRGELVYLPFIKRYRIYKLKEIG